MPRLAGNPSGVEAEALDNRVQVLKSVPVNLSLNTEHPGGPGAPSAALVKAESYMPVYTPTVAGLHYRLDGEEASRVVYEQSPYEVTAVSHGSYVKEKQRSPPDSPSFDEDGDTVRHFSRAPHLSLRFLEIPVQVPVQARVLETISCVSS